MRAFAGIVVAVILLCGCNSRDKAGDALRQAETYARRGEFEKALERHIWFHNHALEIDRSYYGVRLSFALSDWIELGKKYPKALAKLKEIRDAKTARLSAGELNPELFHEVAAINDHLGDPKSTALLFRQIEARNAGFAGSVYDVAEESLLAADEYGLARKYLGDAWVRFATATNHYEQGLRFARMQSENADIARKAEETIFSGRVVRLLAVLDKTGDPAEAHAIQTESLKLLDNEKIRNALR